MIVPTEFFTRTRNARAVQCLGNRRRTEVARVIASGHAAGGAFCIDLSKRKVSAEEKIAKIESFKKAKAMQGVLRHVASLHKTPPEEIFNKVSWPLHKKYGNVHDAFVQHLKGEFNVWK